MCLVGILAMCLFLHVPYLQRQDAEAVNGPGWTLRVKPGVGQGLYLAVQHSEVAVDVLHLVRPVLVGVVNATFQSQSLSGVDMWVADDIL